MRAVNHAQVILNWQENLSKDEIPPEWMWALDDDLEKWFDEVEETRQQKYGRGDRSDDTHANDTVVPLMQNELTRNRRRR
jgi:hypothetical protein